MNHSYITRVFEFLYDNGEAESRKARFGGLLKEGTDAIKRPLTGMFRRTGKTPKKEKEEEREVVEPTVSSAPTSSMNMARISATLESVQLEDDYESSFQERNPERGSKLTLTDAVKYGSNMIHPLTRYFKVGDVDVSILARNFPKEKMVDEDGPWTAQSLFNALETRVKKEKMSKETSGQEPIKPVQFKFTQN